MLCSLLPMPRSPRGEEATQRASKPTPVDSQGLLQPGAPAPAWLTDQKLLSPLLAAYDTHLEQQARQFRELL